MLLPRKLWWVPLAGLLADRLVPDPQQHHPVAVFGNYASFLERKLYRDNRKAGAVFLLAAVVPPVAVAAVLQRQAPALATGAALWAAIGQHTLGKVGSNLAAALAAGDLEGGRNWLPWLVSRDPAQLDEAGIVRATVESLAENTVDATIAPLLFSLGGAPLVVLHRTVNTLDAMVGYHNDRYENFGWAAAKTDDVLAWLPARFCGAVHVAAGAVAGKEVVQRTVRAWRSQARLHPSPNAGVAEATAAALLEVKLGGRTVYRHGVEQRPELGCGPAPTVATISQAVRLGSRDAVVTAATVAAGIFAFGRRQR